MNFSIVSAVTPDYLKKLEWTIPTWVMKPQFQNRKFYLFHHGFKNSEKDLNWIKKYYPDLKLIHWTMDEYDSQRELMLSCFVLGSSVHVEEDFFCKLDADTYFTDSKDVFESKHFELDLFSHSWGYTRPGWWVERMKSFINKSEWNGDKSNVKRVGDKRIQSICCLHKTEFVKMAANLAGKRLPIASHDTYLWYLAEHLKDRKWGSEKLYRKGVSHCSKIRGIREDICSSMSAWNQNLNKELLKNVQIHITDACNLGCNNCDRCCGVARSKDHMSIEQIDKFFSTSVDGSTFNRIDIIGGEPLIHPYLEDIIQLIKTYRKRFHSCKFRITTNGTVNADKIKHFPDWLLVRNSSKDKEKKDYKFEKFNVAPIDYGYYSHNIKSCSIPWRCGIALTKHGFFLCGAGYGVARTFGFDIGIQKWEDVTIDRLKLQKNILCQYCGHSRSIVKNIDSKDMSKTWKEAINNYNKFKPILTVY